MRTVLFAGAAFNAKATDEIARCDDRFCISWQMGSRRMSPRTPRTPKVQTFLIPALPMTRTTIHAWGAQPVRARIPTALERKGRKSGIDTEKENLVSPRKV